MTPMRRECMVAILLILDKSILSILIMLFVSIGGRLHLKCKLLTKKKDSYELNLKYLAEI